MDQKRRLSFLYWGVISIIGILFLFFAAKLFPVYKAIFSFLWKLFAPFLVACLIAYILHPIVKKMEQINLTKSIAFLFIYVLFFVGMSFFVFVFISIIVIFFLFFAAKLFPVYKAIFSFLWKLFAPFLVACLIAYILHPIVKKMEQINLPKSIAILLIYVLFFGGIACLI